MNYNEYLQNLKMMQTIPNYQNIANYTYTPQFRYSYPSYSSYFPFENDIIETNNNKNIDEQETDIRNISNLNEILKTIRELINNERNDIMLYDYLIGVAPTNEDRRILETIKSEKEINYKKIRELYTILSGTTLENLKSADTTMPYINYMEGLKKAINNEIEMCKKLKLLLQNLPNMPEHLKSLMLVLDSMSTISKLNFLLNKNRQ